VDIDGTTVIQPGLNQLNVRSFKNNFLCDYNVLILLKKKEATLPVLNYQNN